MLRSALIFVPLRFIRCYLVDPGVVQNAQDQEGEGVEDSREGGRGEELALALAEDLLEVF